LLGIRPFYTARWLLIKWIKRTFRRAALPLNRRHHSFSHGFASPCTALQNGGLLDNFIRCQNKHGPDRAVYVFWNRMQEAKAVLGDKVTPREWLDDGWMERHGLTDSVNGLLRAVRAAEATAASQDGAAP
jgi:hypothetical protein